MSEIICKICGNTISKRNSLVYGDGRACAHHQEAIDLKDEAKELHRMYNEKLTSADMAIWQKFNDATAILINKHISLGMAEPHAIRMILQPFGYNPALNSIIINRLRKLHEKS